MTMCRNYYIVYLFCFCAVILPLQAKKSDPSSKPEWAKKHISDMTEADMERLLDQWDEDEEPLPPDELPEHLRPAPKLDMSKFDPKDPEGMLKLMKKDKTLMMFVNVQDGLSRDETETITKLWQTSLWNNHLQAERFLIDDTRAIFMFKDGSMAWDAKNFLIKQDKCKEVVIENNTYHGPAAKEEVKPFGPEPKKPKTSAREEL